MADKMSTMLMAIMSGVIGIALLVSLLPTMVDWVNSLEDTGAAEYVPMLSLVLLIVVLVVVIGVVRFFSNDKD